MDNKAMYKLSYGLFVLTAKDGDKANGCITNTAIQVASEPNQISFAINKAHFTHDMVMKTRKVIFILEQISFRKKPFLIKHILILLFVSVNTIQFTNIGRYYLFCQLESNPSSSTSQNNLSHISLIPSQNQKPDVCISGR